MINFESVKNKVIDQLGEAGFSYKLSDESICVFYHENVLYTNEIYGILQGRKNIDDGNILFDNIPFTELPSKERMRFINTSLSFVENDNIYDENLKLNQLLKETLIVIGAPITNIKNRINEELLFYGLLDLRDRKINSLTVYQRLLITMMVATITFKKYVFFRDVDLKLNNNDELKQFMNLIKNINRERNLTIVIFSNSEQFKRNIKEIINLSESKYYHFNNTISIYNRYNLPKISNRKFGFVNLFYVIWNLIRGYRTLLLALSILCVFCYSGIIFLSTQSQYQTPSPDIVNMSFSLNTEYSNLGLSDEIIALIIAFTYMAIVFLIGCYIKVITARKKSYLRYLQVLGINPLITFVVIPIIIVGTTLLIILCSYSCVMIVLSSHLVKTDVVSINWWLSLYLSMGLFLVTLLLSLVPVFSIKANVRPLKHVLIK